MAKLNNDLKVKYFGLGFTEQTGFEIVNSWDNVQATSVDLGKGFQKNTPISSSAMNSVLTSYTVFVRALAQVLLNSNPGAINTNYLDDEDEFIWDICKTPQASETTYNTLVSRIASSLKAIDLVKTTSFNSNTINTYYASSYNLVGVPNGTSTQNINDILTKNSLSDVFTKDGNNKVDIKYASQTQKGVVRVWYDANEECLNISTEPVYNI